MIKLKVKTGEELELGVNAAGLYRIRKDYPDIVDSFYEATEGAKNGSDMARITVEVLYAAYLCTQANNQALDGAMDIDAFMDILPDNLNLVSQAALAIINPNLETDFEKRSKNQHKVASKKQ